MYIDEKEEASYKINEGGVEKSIYINKVENGYVVRIRKEWTEGEGDKKEWKSECKTFISETDPMELVSDTKIGEDIAKTKALVESINKIF